MLERFPNGGKLVRGFDPERPPPSCIGNLLQDKGLARAVSAVDDKGARLSLILDPELPSEPLEEAVDGADLRGEARHAGDGQLTAREGF